METQKILQRKSVRISYWLSRVAGANQTLIMLHGVASNHTRWSEFVLYTELKSEWNLLRLDLRGHGDSMYRGRINRHRWVADLHAIIKKEDLPSVVFLGHSLGAEIALDYAAAYPEQVAGLILIDPVFHENLHGVLGWVRRLQLLLWIPIGLLWLVNSLGLKRREFPARDLNALDQKTRLTLKLNPQLQIADLYMNPFADLPYLPRVNYLQDMQAVVKPLPSLEEISQPVLVIMSGGSSLSDQKRNEQQAHRMPNAISELVHCDHWPLTEQPETVRDMIDNWCKALNRS